MTNLICLIAYILWLVATLVLAISLIGIVVLINGNGDEWWKMGNKLTDGITKD